jgi:hypothetical protein
MLSIVDTSAFRISALARAAKRAGSPMFKQSWDQWQDISEQLGYLRRGGTSNIGGFFRGGGTLERSENQLGVSDEL